MKVKRFLPALAAIGLLTQANAQLWNGVDLAGPALPTTVGPNNVDSYFVPAGAPNSSVGLSEFDIDTGIDFSLAEGGTKPAGITEANGWVNAALFGPVVLEDGDTISITYLGKTAGAINDFGGNLGGSNAFGPGAFTIWSDITNSNPGFGSQLTSGGPVSLQAPLTIDFWLNSPDPTRGGTYSIFDPDSSVPYNSGLPDFDYSARAKLFNVFDDANEQARSILVVAIEDWRNFDVDFTDMFFAIEIYDRDGNPQFPVPEPSTYGLIGAMVLLGLIAVRRARKA